MAARFLLCCSVLWAGLAMAQVPDDSAPTSAEPDPEPPAAPADAVVAGPTVRSLEVAADNPDAAPVVSLVLDDAVGGGNAALWWRADGGAWASLPMAGGPSGLKLARLPDGTQRSGFSFYIEASDDRGGMTAFGTRAAPISVAAAVEGNADRLRNNARDENAVVGPHPAFVMMALGVGVLAGAGAGVFAYDLSIVNARLADVEERLADNPSDGSRASLEASRSSFQDAALQDTTAAILLGVVAGVAIATGTTLLVVGALEQ
jgi:hypothetical protein